MINLYHSEMYWNSNRTVTGPQKVLINLLESLKQENIPVSINEKKYDYDFFLQYDSEGHRKHLETGSTNCIIGPQVWLFDNYGKFLLQNTDSFKKLIVPCEWVKNKSYTKLGLPLDKIAVWPVGIQEFNNTKEDTLDCLIYYKNRSEDDLAFIVDFLKKNNLSYSVVTYGSYNEKDFRSLANKAKFCFVLDNTESQGLALQELMSLGVPLLVWDTTLWDHMGDRYIVPATTVPYWDSRCGEKFYEKKELEKVFNKFYNNLYSYKPKEFIKETLSYKKSVDLLLDIILKN